MIEKNKIIELAEQYLLGTDKYIVDLQISPNNIIHLFIDSDSIISIKDCISLNKYLESKLNRDKEDFELIVSSSGLDLPFKVLRQYYKNINKNISVLLKDGNKHEGTLIAAEEENIILKPIFKKKNIESQEIKFSINDIKETKSIISFKK